MNPAEWQLDRGAATRALEIFKNARHVLMPTHQNVDADGLASPMALQHALAQMGVSATPLVTDGQIPSNLQFLPGIEDVCIYGRDVLPDYDVLCLTDCSDRKRLGAFYTDDPNRVEGQVPIVNIDHHVTNDRYGVIQIIEPHAASAAEIVAEVLRVWNTRITKTIALCLLAGIYGDTLGLRTPATTSRTMRTAADLVDAGVNPAPIVDALFRLKPKSTVCVWEQALRNVHWTGSLIWTELTAEMLENCGALPSEGEGLVNFLAGTEGSRAAAILYANPEGWRVSLRSLPDDVDVAVIASHFGGGGHPRAAGLQVEGGEAEKQSFLKKVAELASPRAALAE
ncbi:MAG: bifunctional oligoribonuclease/PAP phosphatase NrnA [Chloroflexota bacterium]|nr:bifunctional oligoribonuclease/PAP phosphatase NrnA [Chloroflexota bacterium]